jgi:hypothetical protein
LSPALCSVARPYLSANDTDNVTVGCQGESSRWGGPGRNDGGAGRPGHRRPIGQLPGAGTSTGSFLQFRRHMSPCTLLHLKEPLLVPYYVLWSPGYIGKYDVVGINKTEARSRTEPCSTSGPSPGLLHASHHQPAGPRRSGAISHIDTKEAMQLCSCVATLTVVTVVAAGQAEDRTPVPCWLPSSYGILWVYV